MAKKRLRVVVNGLPFTFDVDESVSSEAATQALQQKLQANPELFSRQQERLGFSNEDLEDARRVNAGQTPAEVAAAREAKSVGTFESLMIGVGRSLTSAGRGAQQLATRGKKSQAQKALEALEATPGIPQEIIENQRRLVRERTGSIENLQALEAEEREIFRALDKQGIGPEDLGQLIPDAVAFLGTGGLASIAVRGAILGGVQATSEGEDLGDRGTNALFSGVLSAAGPAAARGLARAFKAGGKVTGRLANSVTRMSEGQGGVLGGLGRTAADAAKAQNSPNPAVQKIGTLAFDRASGIIQQLNARGKQGLGAETANAALQKSIRQVNGQNVVDFAKFTASLAGISRSQLTKELGRTFGKRLDDLRNTFDELTKFSELSPGQAEAVLRNLMGDSQARTLAKAAREATSDRAKVSILQQLVDNSLAALGQDSAEAVENVASPVLSLVPPVAGAVSSIAAGVADTVQGQGQ